MIAVRQTVWAGELVVDEVEGLATAVIEAR
jgi:hypothetical protein